MKLLALFLLVVATYGVSAQKTMVRGPKGGGVNKMFYTIRTFNIWYYDKQRNRELESC